MGKRHFSIMAFTAYTFAAFAQFAGGSGTEKDPYLISDAYQLSDMRNYRTCYFKLNNDIDLTEWIEDNSPTEGWVPVGTEESPFSGFLDGNNCTIRGLVINRPEMWYIGLLGYVRTSGIVVKNLTIDKPTIKGYNHVGTIVGSGDYADILNCKINECNIEGFYHIGGIGGSLRDVTDSHVTIKQIFCKANSGGGIAGVNKNCYNCDVVLEYVEGGYSIGGIVGDNLNCYNCNVRGESLIGRASVGGIAGENQKNENCHVYLNKIKGSYWVGGICGTNNNYNSYENDKYGINNCSVIATQIECDSICGGIIGESWGYRFKVEKCYVATNIIGNTIGGIIGICDNQTKRESDDWQPMLNTTDDMPISDCRFDGNLNSISGRGSGGILGYSVKSYDEVKIGGIETYYKYVHTIHNGMNIYKCISIGGIITNKESASAGICSSTNGHTVENCVSVFNSISGTKAYRIADPDGANKNNVSSIQTKLFENGSEVTSIPDNATNGQAFGDKTLKRASTYTGLGWDLVKDWKIVEGEEYPYPAFLSPYPTVTNYENVSKCVLYGSCPENGKLYVFKKGARYETDIVDNTFEISVGAVAVGETLCYYAQPEGKCPSIVRKIVIENGNSNPSDDLSAGDANGDDTVDAADVVGIINCILGRPAANFVRKNADINGDGQILVDDAVGTVNIIMSNQ